MCDRLGRKVPRNLRTGKYIPKIAVLLLLCLYFAGVTI